ncbi:MAG: hypothetical protein R2752_03240 [Vicinamibacterales bacterium]
MTPHHRSLSPRRVARVIGRLALAGFAALMLTSPYAFILIPGVIGGLGVAAYLWWRDRGVAPPASVPDAFDEELRPDIINMARIRVSGAGGLGLLAMAAAVALGVPRIGQTMLLAAAGGTVMAVVLILRRRASGPLPSDRNGVGGAHGILFADGDDDEPTPRDPRAAGHDARDGRGDRGGRGDARRAAVPSGRPAAAGLPLA